MWNTLLWFMVIIGFNSPQLWVHRGNHKGKDQIVISKDKQPGSLSLQAPLWRNNDPSEYQWELQLSSTKVSIRYTCILKWSTLHEINLEFLTACAPICIWKLCRWKISNLRCKCNTGKNQTPPEIKLSAKYVYIQIHPQKWLIWEMPFIMGHAHMWMYMCLKVRTLSRHHIEQRVAAKGCYTYSLVL